MLSIRTNDITGQTISATILGLWQEYQDIGYPKDPSCYVVRANALTAKHLLASEEAHQYEFMNKKNVNLPFPLPEKRFLWFRLEVDSRLRNDEVIFGPEHIDIFWIRS
jgi:hypothetical protein